jgi:hypothetical protein
MSSMTLPFAEIGAGVAVGEPLPPGYEHVSRRALLVLVGVTGVGKSTTLAAAQAAGLRYRLLPDRRELTDRLILPAAQAQRGETPAPVRDRAQRFALTRLYRETHPGGMGDALAQLAVAPALLAGLLLFDGLRGANEVVAAARQLPAARFVLLDAPDAVRVTRLMGRNDPFDAIGAGDGDGAADQAGTLSDFAALGLPEAAGLVATREEQALLALVRSGAVTAEQLRGSLAIVTEERRNYDPAATRAALLAAAAERTLLVDTHALPPAAVAAAILHFIEKAGL